MKKSPIRLLAVVLVTLAALLYSLRSARVSSQSPPPRAATVAAPASAAPPRLGPTAGPTGTTAPTAIAAPARQPAPRPFAASRSLFASAWRHDSAALAEFAAWTDRYLAAPPLRQAALLPQGMRLAAARRAVLLQLIRMDPRQALAAAVPAVVRARLPATLDPLLEERVGGMGALALLGTTPAPGGPPVEPTFRSAVVNGREYRAYVYGRREIAAAKVNVSLQGIALDGQLAVSESPVRVLEPGEIPAAGVAVETVCPISRIQTPIAASQPLNTKESTAVQVGDTVQVLCHLEHVAVLERALIQQEDQTGPDGQPLAADDSAGTSGIAGRPTTAWTNGPKKVLVIRVDFSDLPGTPGSSTGDTIDEAYVADLIGRPGGVNDFYQQCSYGLTSLSATVTPVYRVPRTAAYYAQGYLNGTLHTDAEALATAGGYDLTAFDRIGVVFSNLGNLPDSKIGYGGLGDIYGRDFWINGYFDFRIVAHELGHTYGSQHCNLWQVSDGDPVSPTGVSIEYGDPFGVMGNNFGSEFTYQFDQWEKSILRWIPDTSVTTANTSGTYRVYRFDHAAANTAHPLALKITRNATQDYWIGFRQLITNSSLQNGAYILWGYHSDVQGNLLDFTTPGDDPTDAALAIGATFHDTAAGITIHPLAKGGVSPNEYLDVQIGLTPTIEWSAPTYTTNRENGAVTLTILRKSDFTGAVSATYTTGNGTALAPADYQAASGVVSWAAGDAGARNITIPVTKDGAGSVQFSVTLSQPQGGANLGTAVATVSLSGGGALDPSFAPNPAYSNETRTIVRQPDGKLLVVVGSTAGYARLNADGSLDSTFLVQGTQTIGDLALQPDGKVLLVGNFTTWGGAARNGIVRLKSDGAFDPTFDPGAGPVGGNAALSCVALDASGRILVGGHFTSFAGQARNDIARLNPDGSLDQTFKSPAFVVFDYSQVFRILPLRDGSSYIGGTFYFNSPFQSGIARLLPTGGLDPSFAVAPGAHYAGNTNSLAEVNKMALQGDGSLLVAGNFTGFQGANRNTLARIGPTGKLDAGFDPKADAQVQSLCVQPDQKILVGEAFSNIAGQAATCLARLNLDGGIDPSFKSQLNYVYEVFSLVLEPAGTVLAGTYPSAGFRLVTGLGGKVSTLHFSTPAVRAREGQSAILTVVRDGGSLGAVAASYLTQNLDALATRFTPVAGTLSWADGDSSARTITMPIATDSLVEGQQHFAVDLTLPGGSALLGDSPEEVVTIPSESGSPALAILSPPATVFQTTPVLVSGTASDADGGGRGIAYVKVNGVTVTSGPVAGDAVVNWSRSVDLVLGNNTITIEAADSAGTLTTRQLQLVYYHPPAITILSPLAATVAVTPVLVAGTASDADAGSQGVAYVKVNGATVTSGPAPGNAVVNWSSPVALSLGNNTITVEAGDLLGTSTTRQLSLSYYFPPVITAPPASTVIYFGQSASLQVQTGESGSLEPALQFQWYAGLRGDTSTPVATGSTFPTGALATTTSYWVRVTNSAGLSSDSATATVTVLHHSLVGLTDGQRVKGANGIPLAVDQLAGLSPTAKVAFYTGATKIGEVDAAPFVFTWHPPGAGRFVLSAVVTGADGFASNTPPVAITVTNLASPGLKASYFGLIRPATPDFAKSGAAKFNTTARNTFTLKLDFGGSSVSLKGAFDEEGTAQFTLGTLQLWLQLEAPNAIDQITGVITDGTIVDGVAKGGTFVSQILTHRLVWNRQNPAPQKGNYTLVLAAPVDPPASAPRGDGAGTVKVSSGGALKLLGTLPDGSKLSEASWLSKDGEWPLFLRGNPGGLVGEPRFQEIMKTSDLDGAILWQQGSVGIELAAVGSRYVKPASLERALVLQNVAGNAVFTAGAGAANTTQTETVSLDSANIFKALGGSVDGLAMKLATATGLFSGSFLQGGQTAHFNGAVLQKQNLGAGHANWNGASAEVKLGPNPEFTPGAGDLGPLGSKPLPTVKVLSPKAKASFKADPTVTVSGTAKGRYALSQVVYQVLVNGVIGPMQPAHGTNAWTINLSPTQDGAYTVFVKAIEDGGAESKLAQTSFSYAK